MPRVVDHQMRRDEIVAAAWQAIALDGIDGATMRRIAELAGCATGRLAHYFDSRNDILVAALGKVHSKASTRMADIAVGIDGMPALRAVLLESLPLDDERRSLQDYFGTLKNLDSGPPAGPGKPSRQRKQ